MTDPRPGHSAPPAADPGPAVARAEIDAALESPNAAHRLARRLLADGDAERAHAVLTACRRSSDALRLLDAACLAALGRVREAHELADALADAPTAPIDARLIAAGLAVRAGDHDGAARRLHANLRDLAEPRTVQALAALAAARGLPGVATHWLRTLSRHAVPGIERTEVEALTRTLGLPDDEAPRSFDADQVHTLANELLADERVVDPLAEGLARLENRPLLRLLRDALRVAGPDLADQAGRRLAEARVAWALGDETRTRRLVGLGLARAPFHAGLRRFALALETPARRSERAA